MPPDAAPIEPDDLLRRTFTSARRGYDPVEVQRYLMALAAELRAGRERERDLQGRLEAAERRATELTEMAPSRLSSLVGEETARVLAAANAAADEIRTRAEEGVARLLREAQDEAATLRRDAESVLARRTAEAEEAAAAIRRQADEVLQQARAEAEAEAEAGRQRGRDMVVEAQRVRERMLRDLARRRKAFRQQIEQLQAGRSRLMAAYDVVRETLDTATEELRVAVPEAKLAAEGAALRVGEEGDGEPFEQELASLDAEVDALADAVDVTEGAVPAGAVDDPAPTPAPAPGLEPEAAGPKAPDPPEGRRSSSVNVVRGPAEPPPPPPPPAPAAPPADVRAATEPESRDADWAAPEAHAPEAQAADADAALPEAQDAGANVALPEAEAEPEPEPGAEAEEGGSPSAKVADLFARMKEASCEADDDQGPDVVAAASAAAEAIVALDDDDEAGDATASSTGDAGSTGGAGATSDAGASGGGPGVPDEPPDPDDVARAARDAAVEPLARRIGRQVKRELSDEQNELLDAVRRQDADLVADHLLPAPEAHVERFAAALQGGLVAAAEAGAASVGAEPATPARTLRELGAEYAAELVAPLRERIGRAFAEAGDDADDLAERLRACYREWRTQRVDGFADHAAVAAFNRGVLDAVAPGVELRWLVDDGAAPSPDCEDNALAGPVARGEAFPTGHAAPPAHPSCRCLLVAATVSVATVEA